MDDLQKYLPFLFIAAYYIFSTISNAKKKKEQDLSKTTLPGGIPNASTSSSEMNKRTKKTKSKSKIATATQLQTVVDYNPEVKSSITIPKDERDEILEEEDMIPFEINLEDNEEWKRAILYSEIINRKYN